MTKKLRVPKYFNEKKEGKKRKKVLKKLVRNVSDLKDLKLNGVLHSDKEKPFPLKMKMKLISIHNLTIIVKKI